MLRDLDAARYRITFLEAVHFGQALRGVIMSQETKSFFERFPEVRVVALEAVDALKLVCESAGDLLLKASDALTRARAKVAKPEEESAPTS